MILEQSIDNIYIYIHIHLPKYCQCYHKYKYLLTVPMSQLNPTKLVTQASHVSYESASEHQPFNKKATKKNYITTTSMNYE